MTYAAVWSRCWTVLGAAGFCLSLLLWGPATVLGALVVGTICSGMLLVTRSSRAEPDDPVADLGWARTGTRSLLIAAGVVGVIAATAVAPGPAVALVLIAVVTSPWTRQRLSGRSAADTTSVPVAEARRWAGEELPSEPAWQLPVIQSFARELSNAELCHEWRRSFLALGGARSSLEFMRVVVLRQLYLDEMDRRSPSALNAWLSSGARAAGGPDRYLRDDRRSGHSGAA
ncbi:MAG: hypothetical protein ABI873_07295 [Marmoricola sp.]